jgi:hypothetical protein
MTILFFLFWIIGAVVVTIIHLYFEIKEEAECLIDAIFQQCLFLTRVNANHVEHMEYCLENTQFAIDYIGAADDDEDVYGEIYRLYFYMPRYSKLKIGLIDYYFYKEKSYKNKKEIVLWQEHQELQELNYFDKLVKKLMKVTIQKQLKKRLPASVKLTSH